MLALKPLLAAASKVLEVDLGSRSEEQEEEQDDRVSLSVLLAAVDNEAWTLLRLRGDACIIAINSLT